MLYRSTAISDRYVNITLIYLHTPRYTTSNLEFITFGPCIVLVSGHRNFEWSTLTVRYQNKSSSWPAFQQVMSVGNTYRCPNAEEPTLHCIENDTPTPAITCTHDDVIKWKHFPRYWPFVRGIHRSPMNSPHKGQWRGALMFSLNCARTNGWANNGEVGDLRRYRAHYHVIVMSLLFHAQSLWPSNAYMRQLTMKSLV